MKKFLSVLLAVMMVATVLPVNLMAAPLEFTEHSHSESYAEAEERTAVKPRAGEWYDRIFIRMNSNGFQVQPSEFRGIVHIEHTMDTSTGGTSKKDEDNVHYISLDYSQCHMPVREMSDAVGHSVRAVYLYSAMADLALRTGDSELLEACRRVFNSIAQKRMYITGGVGSTYLGEAFTVDYDLPNRTAYENVAFALQSIGKPKSVIKVQVPEVLRLVGLEEKMNKMPDQLSGGEQQRVSVARAMVNRPPLLVCDEPTGNLDPAISLGIMKLLDRINRAGTTIVMATHDREMVDSMRKRVIALEAGHVVRDQEKGGYGYYGAL